MIFVRILVFLIGAGLVLTALVSAIKTIILPRGAQSRVTRSVFLTVRSVMNLFLWGARSYKRRDAVLAYYAPIGLILLLPSWLALVLLGYMLMFWSLGSLSWVNAFRLSGSSLLTLGTTAADGFLAAALEFSEAIIGLILLSLLISYLPVIYSTFSRRETAVRLLEVRAGNPPSSVEMILRYNRIHGLNALNEVWRTWEIWFAELEESHTSLAALVFYRSPSPGYSWVTASGAVLDTAALVLALVEMPHDPQADLCIRAGFLALRKIAEYFKISYDPNPHPTDPISISRGDFERVVTALEKGGVALKADREKAWRDFNGWRVNYDTVLLALADLTSAPPSQWTGMTEK